MPLTSFASQPTPSQAVEPMLLDDDLAAILRCSTRTLARYRAADLIPAPVRIGRQLGWRPQEVRDWMEAGCPNRSQWELMKRAEASPRRPLFDATEMEQLLVAV